MRDLPTNTWYAVYRATELGRKPVTVERLGRSYVLWRHPAGLSAAPAQCPHRGADLGAGRVVDGCLACPYHGIRFSPGGTATHRPAQGTEERIPAKTNLATLPTVEAHGFIWLWHGTSTPDGGPEWFDADPPTTTVGADQIWDVHYSRFMESALDFHHVPFVHGTYTPGIGTELTDVELTDNGNRLVMTARLFNPNRNRTMDVGGEVIMPCALRVMLGATEFVAVGTPVDDYRTWVAANYQPKYTRRIPGLRRAEAWASMFVDFKLFQRQDRAIYEHLGDGPSPLERMALMPADRGAALWIRRWREMLHTTHQPDHAETEVFLNGHHVPAQPMGSAPLPCSSQTSAWP